MHGTRTIVTQMAQLCGTSSIMFGENGEQFIYGTMTDVSVGAHMMEKCAVNTHGS